jgi:hypothetical protein
VGIEAISDTSSEFELLQHRYPYNKAKLRWVRATLAIVIRRKISKAFGQLAQQCKQNRAIGAPDPVASKLWSDTGRWLQRHQL